EQLWPKLVHRGNEFFTTTPVGLFVEKAPFRTRTIEGEIYKLARKLCFDFFEFRAAWCKTEGTARGTALVFFGAHFIASCKGTRLSQVESNSDSDYSACYSALIATGPGVVSLRPGVKCSQLRGVLTQRR